MQTRAIVQLSGYSFVFGQSGLARDESRESPGDAFARSFVPCGEELCDLFRGAKRASSKRAQESQSLNDEDGFRLRAMGCRGKGFPLRVLARVLRIASLSNDSGADSEGQSLRTGSGQRINRPDF